MSNGASRRGIVYRLYDAAGALLYIGATGNLRQRFQFHRKDKPWWPDVAGKRLDVYDRVAEAKEAERCAILSEDPVHNISGTPKMAEVDPRLAAAASRGGTFAPGTHGTDGAAASDKVRLVRHRARRAENRSSRHL